MARFTLTANVGHNLSPLLQNPDNHARSAARLWSRRHPSVIPMRCTAMTWLFPAQLGLMLVLVLHLGPLHASPTSAPAPDVEALIRQATQAEQALDSEVALKLFKKADAARPDDAFILQKIARHTSDSIVDLPPGDVAEKKRRAELALAYAQRAVALDPGNAENVLSLAVCHGTLAVYSDTRTKIKYSRLVKEESERALAIDPDYDWAHHLLGRWHYEVATLGAATRFFVRVIYGGLPAASVEQAIVHLERAVALAPRVGPHHLELGFAYRAANRFDDARNAFERGLALPSIGKHDDAAKTRAREALAELPSA
jgi:tetratricopeptide (TPR) repeat protein